jgi:hypothetical protein
MANRLYHWNTESLALLPEKNGFRMRGMEMTRLETFTDAAFAFAVTLLVISVDDVPRSYPEFIEALKQIPAFIGCFAQLMLFWWGHHTWSRRYGLEDGWSMCLSLTLVATVLIYIYPLRAILSAFFANASGNFLPVPFELDVAQIGTLFVIFGAGFSTLAGLLVGLYLIALRRADTLCLSRREKIFTQGDAIGWGLVCLTGIISTLVAGLLSDELSPLAGFVYWSLIVTMPAFGMWFKRQQREYLSDTA